MSLRKVAVPLVPAPGAATATNAKASGMAAHLIRVTLLTTGRWTRVPEVHLANDYSSGALRITAQDAD